MTQQFQRGMIVDVLLDPVKGSETRKMRPCVIVTNNIYNKITPILQVVPITAWNSKKGRIQTNITLYPSESNGLTKKSVADCLQTRPIHRQRIVNIRGIVTVATLRQIDTALKIVFDLR